MLVLAQRFCNLIAGLFITAVTFKVATKKPVYFGPIGNTNGGEHE